MKQQSNEQVPGVRARGRKELIRYMEGEKLTYREAVLAKCYDCMGGYVDSRHDCGIPTCSLYPFMPYRDWTEGKPQG